MSTYLLKNALYFKALFYDFIYKIQNVDKEMHLERADNSLTRKLFNSYINTYGSKPTSLCMNMSAF